MQKVLLCLFAEFFLLMLAGGQSIVAHHFKLYSTKEGLGSPNVRRTFQDSKGFIWCATQDGLYRFNGKRFTGYNKMNPTGQRLSESVVMDMLEHKGLLWVATAFGGIDAIDIIDGQVKYRFNGQQTPGFSDAVLWSLANMGDTLFIGSTKGLYALDMHQKRLIERHSFEPALPESLLITKIKVDSHTQTLWVFARDIGVYALHSKTLTRRAFLPEKNDYLDGDIDADHSVWAGTREGIKKYTLTGQTVQVATNPLPLVSASQGSYIYAVRIAANNLYFSNKNNLVKADLRTGQYTHIKGNAYNNNPEWTSEVFGIMVDNKGFLWLSCMHGLAFSNNRPAAFSSYSSSVESQEKIGQARTIYPYNDSMVVVCAEDGLYRVNINTGSISAIDKTHAYLFCFKDHNNKLIVTNDANSYVLQDQRLIPLHDQYPEFSKTGGAVLINSVTAASDSLFILGTENKRGVFAWDIVNHRLVNIMDNNPTLTKEDYIINNVFKDRSGMVWILADNVVMLFDTRRNSIRKLDLQNPHTAKKYKIFFDIQELDDRFYIASYGSGIIVLNNKFEFVEEITTVNGLANNGVYKLLNVGDSALLVTTNNGLSSVPLKSGPIRNYYLADGLQSNEFEEFSAAKRGNTFFAGGAYGFTVIHPERIVRNTLSTELYWSNINMETSSGTKDSLNLRLNALDIPNNAIQTTVYFSALNFANPGRTVFAYRIKELQRDWINIGNRDFINLIGLNPGKYTLEVTAFNEDGVESIKPIELQLHFLPKWYQTLWFQLLIALLTAGLVYAFFRYRLKQIRARQQIRKDMAGDLHDDIGATLNSVKVFMHLIRRDPGKNEHVEQAEESLSQATTGLRDMIWVLDDSEDTLSELLDRIKKFAVPITSAQQIVFDAVMDSGINQRQISKTEKRNLLLIAKECVNNSVKYAQCKKITIDIQQQNGKMSMRITDDGKGFPVNDVKKGHGLDNIVYRSKQLRYSAEIESSPTTGTIITVKEK